MSASAVPTHWTETVYREHARLLFDVEAAVFQNEALTRRELASVLRLGAEIGVEIESPIVDIACGPGRHTIQLALRGHDVTGLDFSPDLLALASEYASRSRNGGSYPAFVVGDMRHLDFEDGAFNTALILGNSFGYFSDEDNLRALSEACRVLADGGFLCLEITNKQRYLETLEAFSDEIVRGRFFPPLKCEWEKSWDPRNCRVTTQERHSVAATGEVLYEGPYDIRLYDEEEIVGLLEDLGLRSVACLEFAPDRASLQDGLGETFGAMGEVLFVGGIK